MRSASDLPVHEIDLELHLGVAHRVRRQDRSEDVLAELDGGRHPQAPARMCLELADERFRVAQRRHRRCDLAMTQKDLRDTRIEFVSAAKNAIEAGFDGIELHAANGYLLEQFLHPHANRRGDVYGGTVENRARFVVEVADACGEAIGRDRVAVHLSPFSTFNDLPQHDEVHAQHTSLARALRGLLYVHLVSSAHDGFSTTAEAIRDAFGGPVMHNGGFDADRAEATIAGGRAELVSFGRPFIANPDLVERMKRGALLAAPEPATFYTPGARGYVDYLPL